MCNPNITSDEKYLEEHFGKGQPFKVPEHYFEDFSSRLMARLPEQAAMPVVPIREHRSARRRGRWIAAAAAFAGLVMGGAAVWLSSDDASQSVARTAPVENVPVESAYGGSFDELADYAMLDNEDIYAYVSNN